MKRTLNVNIGSVAFSIDEEAYCQLNAYFEDIRSRLYDTEMADIMFDVESRTSDIFRENLSYASQVVDIGMVRKAISVIGSPQAFGDRKYEPVYENVSGRPRKLYRSRTDNVFAGVCGGLAQYFDIDSRIVRLIMIFLFIIGGSSILLYIVIWIVVPLEPRGVFDNSSYSSNAKTRRS